MKKLAWILSIALFATSAVSASEENAQKIGVVNFAECLGNSKFGKQEQDNFENLRTQMENLVKDTENQLKEISGKLQDPEHLDSLSPEGEQELKTKFQMLSQEMQKYQYQYQQVMQQAQMKMIQTIQTRVAAAAESVKKSYNYTDILNKDACFAFTDDITNLVLEQMDKNFDVENTAAKTPEKNG